MPKDGVKCTPYSTLGQNLDFLVWVQKNPAKKQNSIYGSNIKGDIFCQYFKFKPFLVFWVRLRMEFWCKQQNVRSQILVKIVRSRKEFSKNSNNLRPQFGIFFQFFFFHLGSIKLNNYSVQMCWLQAFFIFQKYDLTIHRFVEVGYPHIIYFKQANIFFWTGWLTHVPKTIS